ncbi:MAG: hypothetical protein L0H73_08855 [Nitrococcus sp.]|nr:hypothetical protein [Nitrococcus sp.]
MSPTRRHIARVMIVVLAAGLVGFGLAKLYIWFQARRGVEELARLAAPYASIEWDSVSAGLDGRMQIRGLVIAPLTVDDTLSIKTLTIRLPSGFRPEELVRRLLTGELTGTVRIDAQDVALRSDGALFQQLNQITNGYLWKTPLAALGCKGIEDLDQAVLGQSGGGMVYANVALRLRSPARQLALSLKIDLRELAATRVEAAIDVGHPFVPLRDPAALTTLPVTVSGLHIRHIDRGFNTKRNLLCASQQNMSVAAFLDRHLGAVRALYRDRKLAPSDQLLTQYRDFAGHGGEILIALNFDEPVAAAKLYRMDEQQLLTHARVSLAINGVSIQNPSEAWQLWINSDDGRFPAAAQAAAAESSTAQPSFHDIPVADLVHHVGERTRIITGDGSHHMGVLEQIDAGSLTLRWELSGGYVRFSIAADKIEVAQVYGNTVAESMPPSAGSTRSPDHVGNSAHRKHDSKASLKHVNNQKTVSEADPTSAIRAYR